jgi:hypothetical protein
MSSAPRSVRVVDPYAQEPSCLHQPVEPGRVWDDGTGRPLHGPRPAWPLRADVGGTWLPVDTSVRRDDATGNICQQGSGG